MKPDSPTGGNGSSEETNTTNALRTIASVINVTSDMDDGDFDMDDEVMTFMHSHIHKQLIRFTTKDESDSRQGLMDGDTKAYFDEVIRGSALFGLLPDNEEELDDDQRVHEDAFFSGHETLDDDNQRYVHALVYPDAHSCHDNEESETSAAKLQLSRLLLTKKVAEAFMLKSGMTPGDDNDSDIPFGASESSNSVSWGSRLMKGSEKALHAGDCNDNNSGTASRQSEYSIETDLQAEREKLQEEDNAPGLAKRLETDVAGSLVELWQHRLTQSTSCEGDLDIVYGSEVNSTGPPSPRGDDISNRASPSLFASNMNAQVDGNGNRSLNPTAPARLPLSVPNDSSSGAALEEIRSRLRKTQFDYTSDSGQRVPEATPQFDYRDVLKKKDKM